ncbi:MULTISPECIES: DUF1385 domain-containing protein [unclassified Halanaerobium]|uniref:DUF1385 domain-containing protein n=1 Tax=unclassified Halanaerobium TaxID=2641197 RepID=UPI000DF41570|nr:MULTISPECIES: DUF1385 domain-containing protein [unclassified Halanaerobium]RCW43843.1 uncharacterized protein YqhQ [Halanaerobium sp. MA284_MarDTE_T2]RCW80829.1 uncharacterized protein YqhQ [Halanaerobium sp. DL-01]
MSDKENIGGRAYKNGVRLMDSRRSVKAYYDEDNNLQISISSVKQNDYFRYFKKIPIIRGIFALFFALWEFFKEVFKEPKKYWFVFFILAADIIFFTIPESAGEGFKEIFFLIYFSIPLILILLFKSTVSEVLKFHGAEHKAVNYYENGSEGEIANYSRIHKRCGSNIVFYYLLITFISGFFNIGINFFIQEILFLGIAYEIMKITPDRLLFIPSFFQKIFAREPEEEHIKAAEAALKILKKGSR